MAWNPNVFAGAPKNPQQHNFVYGIAVGPYGSSYSNRVFICGDFYTVGTKHSGNVAAVNAVTGALDNTWRSGTDGGTPACVLGPGDLLYIGGHFRKVGGIHYQVTGLTRNHVAALPATTPPLRGGCYCAYPNSWNPSLSSILGTHAIATSPGWIVVGGDFATVNGKPQAKLAVFPLSAGAVPGIRFGTKGDIPVPADYNGDGRADLAVFRPSTGLWYVRGVGVLRYGTRGDIPVPADYNGDGRADIAVFRPSTGVWYVYGVRVTAYGTKGDVPVPRDYNGDRRVDLAVFRPSTGVWYVLGVGVVRYGARGDVPVPADYNGDRRANVAVFRPSNGSWFLL